MSELFDEVDEEVRRDQLKKLWDKYSLFIIALAILVVAGVGGWRGYQYLEGKKAAEAGAAFDRAVELSDQNKHAEAEAAFADLITKAPSGYRNLARLRMAAEVATRDQPAAAKLYDAIAADRSVGGPDQDLARIRAAQMVMDTTTYPNMVQRLEAMATSKDSTFRHSARELLALSAWRANDATAARQWLDQIANDGETPPSLRSRAEALQALLPPVAKS
ncbi:MULTISPECIES: tetratricopeptide repeat protein [unclassified Bradyrhizobium]|uniref:tetratricopeptide repeat protein n=1 Tax=unclassified Bradyrhizobium TaxID=2631580 RepID=UPI001BAAC7D4|nr:MULTISPECIES: tetratricopeptide repeat protein [unclassified Bradyrhizobium]MBR1205894.1 tetratricopeptide repeat protein [Bradyrhizobium sp. AUGA SZCCT0124]MBR1315717.1 tetratricopeptide repeat protein [Bradyrhizobium sp. AUGA SZCCT0051]MBR1338221.1 tetratricopeptide repeat protein [Bradyrhizobium sp. AUGA SZCCT0105]MBR1355876.1 tetratricopeptide repeat protein [Bradyrhizobium sp. AUGA SZCCT0045]